MRWLPSPKTAAALTMALCSLLLALACYELARYNSADASQKLSELSQRISTDVSARMRQYEFGIRGARGAVLAGGGERITRQRFNDYSMSRDIDHEFPGARGFGFIFRIPPAALDAFVMASREDGWPTFNIKSLAPHEGDRYIIRYIEPVARNQAAVGLDIASESNRREAARTSMLTGQATLTGPITLVQASGHPMRSFLLMMPAYRPGASPASAQEREAATIGWAYAPLLIDEVLAGLFNTNDQIELTLRDRDGNDQTVFYRSPNGGDSTPDALQVERQFDLYGRTWVANFRTTPAFWSQLHQIPVKQAAAFGMGLTLLLTALAYFFSQSRVRAHQNQVEQARRAAIVDSTTDAIIGESMDGKVIEWNRGAVLMFGYDTAEALGKTVAELILPRDLLAEDARIRGTMQSGEAMPPLETKRMRRDGQLIDVSVSAAPIRDKAGRHIGFAKTIRDISDSKRTQQAIIELNTTLEQKVADRTALLEAANRDNAALLQTIDAHAIVSVTDRLGRITDVNDAFCKISGFSRDELIGQTHQIVNSNCHDAAFWSTVWQRIGERRSWRGEICNRARDGSLYWMDSIISPFLDAQGEVEKYISIQHEITKRKRMEVALQETSTQLTTVLNSASEVAIIACDAQGKVTMFNTGAQRMLGYTQDEVADTFEVTRFFDPAELQTRAQALSAKLSRDIKSEFVLVEPSTLSVPHEWTFVRRDGERLSVSLVVTAMRDNTGAFVGHLGVAHDITQQKRYETSLKEAMQKASLANKAKSQFLANMSHEIRTPMNAVIGLSYLMERTSLDVEQAGFLSKIKSASKALLGIINDVLDLSKIEAQELTIEQTPFQLPKLLAEVSDLIRIQADNKHIGFAVQAPDDLPKVVVGDPTRVHQILTNLLSNAVKFTQQGGVNLSVIVIDRNEHGIRARFEVQDSGVGITSEAMARLFTPFAQADASTTRRFGGTGLGLSIVKQLATLMGGDIGASSTPQVGSTFWVELPFSTDIPTNAHSDEDEPDLSDVQALAGARILVADDNEINLEVARRILEQEGATVTLTSNGQEAVDALLAAPDAFDVVLLDVQMPVLDGHDASRRIRTGLGLTRLPIIALTAGTLTSEMQLAKAAGMNDFVGKPFSPKVLVQCIRRHVNIKFMPAKEVHALPSSNEDTAQWPDIDGIDAQEARLRLGGDPSLFLSLLRRLPRDFADIRRAVEDLNAASLPDLSARMHSLKGSSGTLGARTLQLLAAEAELACKAKEIERALPLLNKALAEMDALWLQTERLVQARESKFPSSDSAPIESVSPAALHTLIGLMRESNLEALSVFESLAQALSQQMQPDAYGRLHQCMDDLKFNDAQEILATLVPSPSKE